MRFFLLFCSFFLLPLSAFADDRFNALDADKDGKVSWEEFHAINTNMPRVAFDTIDLDKDTFLTHEEWEHFISTHNSGAMGQMPSSMQGGIAMPPKTQTLPAKDPVAPNAPAPANPQDPLAPVIAKPASSAKPLLMPPAAPKEPKELAPANAAPPAQPIQPVQAEKPASLATPTVSGLPQQLNGQTTALPLTPTQNGVSIGSSANMPLLLMPPSTPAASPESSAPATSNPAP